MTQQHKTITGNKGGGKGGGGTARVAVESPNTLRSRSTARVVDLISEGEIEGLVNGNKSIFFNDTPLESDNGDDNFTGVSLELRSGTPEQDCIANFDAIEREVAVGIELTKLNSEGNPTFLTRTITDPDINAVRIKIRIPQLTNQNTTNGDLRGSSVSFDVFVKPSGGSFTSAFTSPPSISGKTTSPYESAYRIPLPEGGAPWEIKLERLTDDNDKANIQNKTFWSSYTELIVEQLTYPDSALIGVNIDAQQFGSSIPTRAYEVKGLIINVPNNYDPGTRVYTGVWDGTFKLAWSDNPAWVLYDLLTNKRYGLGDTLTTSQVDKWSLYTIAQYCDVEVDDGFGGTEPRMTFNTVINSQQEAYDVINAIASAFRGMLYWGAGTVIATQDAPADPVKLVGPANVIDGQFNYEGAALKARHSVALVTWNDPADAYRPAIAVVEDPDMIARYGWKQADVVAYGATSKGQAVRFGKWLLDSEQHETETVTYRAALDHADVRPGDVISIADPAYAGVRFGGRVKTITSTTELVLDDTITLEANESYTLSVVLADGSVEDKAVTTAASTTNTLTLESALTDTPLVGAMWVLTASNVAPRKFRVVAVTEQEKNIFEVTALLHDANKYQRVEENIFLEEPDYSALPSGDISPPTEISSYEYLYEASIERKSAVTLSWTAATDPRVNQYEIEMIHPNESEYQSVGITNNVSYDIKETIDGTYQFRVRSLGGFGQHSVWVEYTKALITVAYPPDDVTGFKMSVIDGNTHLSWEKVKNLDLSHYQIRHSSDVDANWLSSNVIRDQIETANTTVETLSGIYLIKAVDQSGEMSINPSIIRTDITKLHKFNFVASLQEEPLWQGNYSGTVYDENYSGVRLAADDFYNWIDVFTIDNWYAGLGGLNAEGYYYFNQSIDLDKVFTSNVKADMTVNGVDIYDDFFAVGDIYSLNNILGFEAKDYDFELQIRTTKDDPALTPTWTDWKSFIVGDYEARALEFRALFKSFQDGTTPILNGANIQVDMPDRVDGKEDLVATTSGLNVTFDPEFRARPVISITGQNMLSGDYFTINNQSPTGFDIQFFNSSSTSVERTFDYLAKGYGYVSSN